MKYGIRGSFGAVVLACLLFWSGCGEVRAFVDPPVLVPEHPKAFEPVYVRLRAGVCDGFAVPSPMHIFIESTGPNAIRIRVDSSHYDDPNFCWYGPGISGDYPLGSFSPGTYQVEVQRIYETIFGQEIETLGMLELQVAKTSAPVIVPAVQNEMLWTLALLVVLTTALMLHRRLD